MKLAFCQPEPANQHRPPEETKQHFNCKIGSRITANSRGDRQIGSPTKSTSSRIEVADE
jgi:hypothetical protein